MELIINDDFYGFYTQLDKSRQECDELSHKLKLQQHETEHVRQESTLDIEKVYIMTCVVGCDLVSIVIVTC